LRIRKSWPREEAPLETGEAVKRLRKIMETEKPYLDSNLKYSDLAAKLGISVRHLSRVLNEELGISFNEFVNAYRIKEVQAQLLNKENGEHTLLAIALDAGFNSKTSFNRIFKDHTGMTPTEFVRKHKTGQARQ
jgi:AraC-like DNA-binding protein